MRDTLVSPTLRRWSSVELILTFVEPVIGIIKEIMGVRQFSLLSLAAAAGEWCLVCLAFNLKWLHVLLAGQV